jgi:DNA-binding GntR family transcriptional regulator
VTVASPPGSWNSGLQIQNRESKIQVMAISNHPGGGLRPASEQYRTKVDIATDQLREWILSGDLHYGERLDQARLAATLDVSRMPLRQALLRLADEGLIEAPPHRSAVVTRLSTTELEDLYQARRAMEGVLAELGSQRRDESCVRAMERGLREQEKAVAKGDLRRWVELDREFHFVLYRAAGQPRSYEITAQLRSSADRYIRHYASYRSGAATSVIEHREILELCRARDGAGIRSATERHVLVGLEALRPLVGGENE